MDGTGGGPSGEKAARFDPQVQMKITEQMRWCSECTPEKFVPASHFTRHQREKHSLADGAAKLICPYCDKKFVMGRASKQKAHKLVCKQ